MQSVFHTFFGNANSATLYEEYKEVFDLSYNTFRFKLSPDQNSMWKFLIRFSSGEDKLNYSLGEDNMKSNDILVSIGQPSIFKSNIQENDVNGSFVTLEYNGDSREFKSPLAGVSVDLELKYTQESQFVMLVFSIEDIVHQIEISLKGERYLSIGASSNRTSAKLICEIQQPLSSELINNVRVNLATKLDLSNTDMIELPLPVKDLVWLEELIIASGSFYDNDLELTVRSENRGEQNLLEEIPDWIAGLVNLKKLIIAGTKSLLKNVNFQAITSLTNLEALSIQNTGLSDLTGIEKLQKLRALSISNNRITDIGPVRLLLNLTAFRFRGNKVKDIRPVEMLTNLRLLRFGKNQVTDIDPLVNLTGLKTLSCYSNQIRSLAVVRSMKGLLKLDCKDNKIGEIYPLTELNSLQELDISKNAIRDLTPLGNLLELKKLAFADNKLTRLSGLPTSTKLRELDFSGNNIVEIRRVGDLEKVEILNVSDNKIQDIKAIGRLKLLKKLNIRKNIVSDISSIATLSNLTEIDFGYTAISDISSLVSLPSLRFIYFENASVGNIEPLSRMNKLEMFDCSRCPVKDCPTDVYETLDITQIRAFFQGKEQNSIVTQAADQDLSDTSHKDVKLVILGNSNTGKTNFVNYLESGKFTGERKSSHGMDVKRWKPDNKRFPLLNDVTVSIWDFGGQEYYHESYKLFLSANAIYILFWSAEYDTSEKIMTNVHDGSTPELLQHFEILYWLDTIRYYAGKFTSNPLIAVQNKVDSPDLKSRISQQLHKDYGIRDSFHISLKEGNNPENELGMANLIYFMREIEFAINNAADKTAPPQHWQLIRNEILRLKSDNAENKFTGRLSDSKSISVEEFVAVCNGFLTKPLDKDEQYTIPRWLDRGGVIIYFPDIPGLKEKLFLDPAFLAGKIYQVLSKQVYEKGGEFFKTDIVDFKEELIIDILEVTMHLKLVYLHPDKITEHYIAPQYLPDKHAIEDLYKIAAKGIAETSYWVSVPIFHYRSILHNLLIHYASATNTQFKYYWKNGILFTLDGYNIIIKGFQPYEKNKGVFLIGVEQGPKKNDIVKEVFNKILHLLDLFKLPEKVRKATEAGENEDHPIYANIVVPEINRELLSGIDLTVSYDGKNYVKYGLLLQNELETRIMAENNTWLITKNFGPILPYIPVKGKKVFLSYSHQNIAWLARLRVHLSALRNAKEIESWDDEEIMAGDRWNDSIVKRLEEADVFILLLSADFIASEYILRVELKAALAKYHQRKAVIIPILFEPIDLKALSLVESSETDKSFSINDFEIIPKEKGYLKPVSLWSNAEEALSVIAQRIREVLVS